jgi:hypothetical protein
VSFTLTSIVDYVPCRKFIVAMLCYVNGFDKDNDDPSMFYFIAVEL